MRQCLESKMFVRSFTRSIFTSALCLARVVSTSSYLLNPMTTIPSTSMSFIDAKTAQLIDDRLMNQNGFSIDQLMELAGLSVANAAHELFVDKYGVNNPKNNRKLLVFCGPGNNGGDGLVAARHLKYFGYSPTIVYPKQGKSTLFMNLVKQCIDLEIAVLGQTPSLEEVNSFGLVVDGLFGFSFQGPVRSPFDEIIRSFRNTKTPILSIDLPSGWDVNDGDVHQTGFIPDAVISLTLPKNCMKSYNKVHYLGGRFVPPTLSRELGIIIPDYGYNPTQILKIESVAHIKEEVLSEAVVMYTSAPNIEEAKNIANTLVRGKIAACVNIVPQVVSVFEWDGKIDNSDEILLMIKTKKDLAPTVTETIKKIHSYELPESIVVGIQNQGSNPQFVQWILDSTLPTTSEGSAKSTSVDTNNSK